MKFFRTIVLSIALCSVVAAYAQDSLFDIEKDLLLAQFDCKTDVDDLHTVAAFATLIYHEDYSDINYHAIAGTYGIQEGLYVPPNDLFELAFGANWSDAHTDSKKALKEVLQKINNTLANGGDIWAADAGQSDFSALWMKALSEEHPELDTKARIHIVQHSDWNEEVTDPESLTYVKTHADYHRIPDGNAIGNGTPGFRSDEKIEWKKHIENANLLMVWEKAIALGNKYNGKEGRYLNESIAKGGLDFSDLSEICYMLKLKEIRDGLEFFSRFRANR